MTDTPSEAAIEEALRRAGWSDSADMVAEVRRARNESGKRSILAHAKTLQEVDRVAREAAALIETWVGNNDEDGRRCALPLRSLMLPDPPDPDEELAREVAEQWFVETLHDAAKQAALATIKRLRADGRLTDG